MLKKLSLLAAASALMAFASTAQAMSPAPVATGSDVTLTAGGCGGGFHRGPYGHCVPNGYYRPAVVCHNVMTAYGWRRVCR